MAELKDIKDAVPNDTLIEMLERWLKQAKDGEIRSVVGAIEWNKGGVISTSWSIDWRTNRVTMIGALTIAQYELSTKECLSRSDTILSTALYGE